MFRPTLRIFAQYHFRGIDAADIFGVVGEFARMAKLVDIGRFLGRTCGPSTGCTSHPDRSRKPSLERPAPWHQPVTGIGEEPVVSTPNPDDVGADHRQARPVRPRTAGHHGFKIVRPDAGGNCWRTGSQKRPPRPSADNWQRRRTTPSPSDTLTMTARTEVGSEIKPQSHSLYWLRSSKSSSL